MTTPKRPGAHATLTSYANLTATLALVVSLGGGAYAAGLAKDSVRSKQIKNAAVRTVDLADGAVTGTKVADGTLTGADIDESTLDLPAAPEAPAAPPAPFVTRSAVTSGTLDGFSTKVAEIVLTVPEAGYVDVTASAAFNGRAGSLVVDAVVMLVSTEVARGSWDAGDPDGILDMQQAAHGVVPVPAGTHTFKYFISEGRYDGAYSTYADAQLIVRYFPEGQVG